ncbi:MAG: response regulator [Verrucomicrobia bacterium]|nr:response regulator [Verrucomicrobiota bacterium]
MPGADLRGTQFFLRLVQGEPTPQATPSGAPGTSQAESAIVCPRALGGHLLLVDDEQETRDLLQLLLQSAGYRLSTAPDGASALRCLEEEPVDLILLDLFLPETNGYEVLEQMRQHPQWKSIPVIVISGTTDMDNVVRCVELGAEEFLPKPFNPLLLRTRISAGLEKKRLRDQEQAFLKQLSAEREKSERLLLNVLPAAIAERLKQGEATIAESYLDVTVMFADIASFTQLSERTPAQMLVELLNEVFSAFDRLAERHGLEKIKTIGDSYMAVGGLPVPCANHAERVARMAIDMQVAIRELNVARGTTLAIRVGIHSGPVVAGIIGRRKFSYDLWGDTVNLASRMESHGQAGEIQVSETTKRKLEHLFQFAPRGPVQIKGKGELPTYLLCDPDGFQP